jgi:hypothetical protein
MGLFFTCRWSGFMAGLRAAGTARMRVVEHGSRGQQMHCRHNLLRIAVSFLPKMRQFFCLPMVGHHGRTSRRWNGENARCETWKQTETDVLPT